MDENPYQSPTATDDIVETIAISGAPRKPPSRWEITLFGAMVGVLYWSAAGFVLGIAFGIKLCWLSGSSAPEIYLGTAFQYAIASAMVGVPLGALVGGLLVNMYWSLPRTHWCGWLNWFVSRGLHLYLGIYGGVLFFVRAFDDWRASGLTADRTTLVQGAIAVECLILGWIVARLIDRRLNRSLEKLRTDAADVE